MLRFRMIFALLTAALFFTAGGADAQMPIPLPTGGDGEAAATVSPDSPEAVREMVSRLSDEEVRAMLLDRLDAVAAEEAANSAGGGDGVGGLTRFFNNITYGAFGEIITSVQRLPLAVTGQARAFTNFYETAGSTGILIIAVALIGGVIAGLIIEMIFNRLTANWLERAAAQGTSSLMGRIKFLFYRLCQDLFGVFIFFFVARWVGFVLATTIFAGAPELELVPPVAQVIWIYLIVMPRFAAAFSRFILAPKRPEFRLVHTDDATAKFLHRNQIGLIALMGFTIAVVSFNALNGVPTGEIRIGFWLNFAVHAYIAWMAWQAREGLVMMMRGADPDITPTEAKVARAYPYFAIGVSAVTWWVVQVMIVYGEFELLRAGAHYWTMALLLFAPALDTLVRGLVQHLVPPMQGKGQLAERAYIITKRSYIRVGRVIVFAIVVFLIARLWGIQFQNLAAAGVGAQFAGRFLEILMVIAAGYLVYELVTLWFNRKLAAENTAAGFDLSDDEPGGGEGGQAGGSRMSTVLPLLMGVVKGAIIIVFALIALGNIGIDITPLLAGAGILGLAVGFGAQKLVADVVSGVFFLVDDAFRSGEYVEISGTVGTVEKISIRSMQLRHHKGPVHTIPYGEIPQITNFSRDWVIMKLKFTVPFDTDPNLVKKIFKQIGKEMMEVPEFAQDMLQPFKSQGVFDFDDVGMIIRGKFMAKPGKQFTLRKEIFNRVKKAFEAHGIDFARREIRVAIPNLEDAENMTEEEKTALAAGASEAARNQMDQK